MYVILIILCDHFQEKSVRDFLLTNICRKGNHYEWRVNLESIITSYDEIVGFPVYDSCYMGNTLFIGGRLSTYIRFVSANGFFIGICITGNMYNANHLSPHPKRFCFKT